MKRITNLQIAWRVLDWLPFEFIWYTKVDGKENTYRATWFHNWFFKTFVYR